MRTTIMNVVQRYCGDREVQTINDDAGAGRLFCPRVVHKKGENNVFTV